MENTAGESLVTNTYFNGCSLVVLFYKRTLLKVIQVAIVKLLYLIHTKVVVVN